MWTLGGTEQGNSWPKRTCFKGKVNGEKKNFFNSFEGRVGGKTEDEGGKDERIEDFQKGRFDRVQIWGK
jgi:hypothetical protein